MADQVAENESERQSGGDEVDDAVIGSILRKRYRGNFGKEGQVALEHLDLRLPRGEALMLVGPNGAGKSTALRLIAGIERPDSGSLKVFGASARDMSNRRRVGYLPDASELFPFLDVVETLEFFGTAANLSRAEIKKESDELVELFGMKPWQKKRVKTYSLGMRRRLGLACVLIGKPDLLLLDEPTSGLDPAATRLFLDVCRREKSRGASLIISSHHLRQVERLCDQVIVLKKGRVEFSGAVSKLAAEVGRVDLELSSFDLSNEDSLRQFLSSIGADVAGIRISERGLEDFLLGEDS
ncbi:MAG: ABC-type multidrug transport system ATPase subunit [Planctomycetota bacterium]